MSNYLLKENGCLVPSTSAVLEAELITVPHLEPLVIKIQWKTPRQKEASDLGIKVLFSCHCWTEKDEGISADKKNYLRVKDGLRQRIFDPVRYELSKKLPEMLKNLEECCFFRHRKHSNYAFYAFRMSFPDGKSYIVFCDMKKRRGIEKGTPYKLILKIQSAYLRQPLEAERGKFEKIKLKAIIKKTFEGK